MSCDGLAAGIQTQGSLLSTHKPESSNIALTDSSGFPHFHRLQPRSPHCIEAHWTSLVSLFVVSQVLQYAGVAEAVSTAADSRRCESVFQTYRTGELVIRQFGDVQDRVPVNRQTGVQVELTVVCGELQSEAEIRTESDVAGARRLPLRPQRGGQGRLRLFHLKAEVGAVVRSQVFLAARSLTSITAFLSLGLAG